MSRFLKLRRLTCWEFALRSPYSEMKVLIFWSLFGRLDCGWLLSVKFEHVCPWSISPKVKPCMLRSVVLAFDNSKTLMVRIGDRSSGVDVMTMAKRPRGEKNEMFA